MKRTRDNRQIKADMPKYDSETVKRVSLDYLLCSEQQISSISMTGELKYCRKILFYMLFMHSAYTTQKISQLFTIPGNTINQLVAEAHLLIERGDRKTTKDINKLLTLLKNNNGTQINPI